ncbi:MAG TPA: protein-L-isoaspartate(D-aspartate) O-methyltransferase [Dehalococcoidia bacterium]|nr:protein-L-isoaspartate(D-aspartate) O-methyltransferase [Dehalococcoidia bacterium]
MIRFRQKRNSSAKAALLEELRNDISDQRVLAAIGKVPRERFLPAGFEQFAYENRPFPIGEGQTISQPTIVAVMTEALELTGGEKVLEVGTGSGYQAAILAELAREVVTVERIPVLAQTAAEKLKALGYRNIRVYEVGDVLGYPEEAPYDAIIVTAGAPTVPGELLLQLAPGGRMVIPVGGRDLQELVLVRKSDGGFTTEKRGACRFVPLVGPGAWELERY